VGVLDGTVTPRQYAPDRLADPAVHALMETVSVAEAADMTARRAANPGLIPARATVETAAESYTTTIDYPTGHWQSPMTQTALTEKVTELVGDALGADSLAELEAWCGAAADQPDVDGLLATLAGESA
jgi:2-methylcitrate dehydratase